MIKAEPYFSAFGISEAGCAAGAVDKAGEHFGMILIRS